MDCVVDTIYICREGVGPMRSQGSSKKARWLALVLLPLVTLGLVVPAQATPSATSAVSLPTDEGPHPSSVQEWWYFNGHVSGVDPSGKLHKYGVLLSFIRRNPGNTAPTSARWMGAVPRPSVTR